jgi:hypothetical protein
MPLVQVVLILIVVGVLLWLLNNYGTMVDAKIKQIINIVVVIVVVLWLLGLFFDLGSLSTLRIGRH